MNVSQFYDCDLIRNTALETTISPGIHRNVQIQDVETGVTTTSKASNFSLEFSLGKGLHYFVGNVYFSFSLEYRTGMRIV